MLLHAARFVYRESALGLMLYETSWLPGWKAWPLLSLPAVVAIRCSLINIEIDSSRTENRLHAFRLRAGAGVLATVRPGQFPLVLRYRFARIGARALAGERAAGQHDGRLDRVF
jgi:hypothetical protein